MKRKYKTLTTLTITLLILSLVLVAIPTFGAGQEKTTYSIEETRLNLPKLVATGTSTAEWVASKSDGMTTENYVAKLYTTYETDDYAGVEIIPTEDMAFTIGELSYAISGGISFRYFAESGSFRGPLLELRFIDPETYDPETGAGHVDITVNIAELSPLNSWTTQLVDETSTVIYFGNNPDGTPFYDNTGSVTLGNVETSIEDASQYTDVSGWELVRVQVQLGWYALPGWVDEDSTVYIDKVTINGVTEGFDPRIKTDYQYYKMGDEVKVTVFDIGLNTRPTIKDSGTFIAASDYPDQITVSLLETGPDTCIFEGTFTVVKEEPGANDLLVKHGNTITVSYTCGGEIETAISDTAQVDAKAPSVTTLNPEKNENISDTTPTVSATVSAEMVGDSGLVIAWLSLDGIVRDTIDDYGPLSYTIQEMEPLEEGVHSISVTAKDLAGNINVTTWTFTVDTTKPTCTISWNITKPAVKNGDAIEFTFTFNDDMDRTSTLIISGNATDYISPVEEGGVAEADWKDLRTFVSNFTVTATDFNGTVLLEVSGAEDKAGNKMIPANFTFYIDTVDPTAPENLTATKLAHDVVLSWDASEDLGSGVVKYNIYRNGTKVGSVNHPTTTFTDEDLAEGAYEYKVGAVDAAGNEANSTALEVEFIPAAVTEWDISLSKGWNLISLPLIPDNSSIEAVLSEVIENVSCVWAYDAETGAWLMYNPDIPEISDLTTMEDGVGYWINMTSASTLTIHGKEFPEPPATPPVYHVVEGWNLIGYKETVQMNASEYLEGVEYIRLYTYADGRWKAVRPTDKMVPGQGYWIAVSEEGSIYP